MRTRQAASAKGGLHLVSYGPTDTPYVRTFFKQLAPAWLDHVALINGFAPPPRRKGFAWCELGCGQGVTPNILAATHPHGSFFGIDAFADHIQHCRRLAGEAGATNATFYETDFTNAFELTFPKFDYVVLHGVYTWVNANTQKAILRFIDTYLKPGGLVYVSYNSMPGWARNLALQHLIFALSRNKPGDTLTRITSAARVARSLALRGAPALVESHANSLASFETNYLAHEYLVRGWKPLYVTDVRSAMKKIRLFPVGSATLIENYDTFVLRGIARNALKKIADENLRELARDYFLNTAFRCDVFTRAARRLGDIERVRRLYESRFTLAGPAASLPFSVQTRGGTLKFDNDTSRHIVGELALGPRRLADIGGRSIEQRSLIANALTLSAANVILPVEGSSAVDSKLMPTICRRLDGPDELLYLPLPCGTALPAARGLLRRLRDGCSLNDYPGWDAFLAAHC